MICLNAFRQLSRHLWPQQTRSLTAGGLRLQAFHQTSVSRDLMEFFDDPKNWGETEVKTGLRAVANECGLTSAVCCPLQAESGVRMSCG